MRKMQKNSFGQLLAEFSFVTAMTSVVCIGSFNVSNIQFKDSHLVIQPLSTPNYLASLHPVKGNAIDTLYDENMGAKPVQSKTYTCTNPTSNTSQTEANDNTPSDNRQDNSDPNAQQQTQQEVDPFENHFFLMHFNSGATSVPAHQCRREQQSH